MNLLIRGLVSRTAVTQPTAVAGRRAGSSRRRRTASIGLEIQLLQLQVESIVECLIVVVDSRRSGQRRFPANRTLVSKASSSSSVESWNPSVFVDGRFAVGEKDAIQVLGAGAEVVVTAEKDAADVSASLAAIFLPAERRSVGDDADGTAE